SISQNLVGWRKKRSDALQKTREAIREKGERTSRAFFSETNSCTQIQSMALSSFRDACPTVKNILLLDSEGKRVAVKYYSDDWPTNNSKLAFEKALFTKTMKTNARTEAEITMFDNYIVVYKFTQDLHFFVTGGDDENELILNAVLQGFFDSVALLLRMILETDPNVIAGKVAINSMDPAAPLSEQTISQALATAREHLTRTLFQ
ncbi:Coatomer subunit zeta-2, partial [Linum perenne]